MIGRIAALAACTIVAIGIVLAFGVIGTPAHQRLIALDQRRVDDLDGIYQTIIAEGTHLAPARLTDIQDELSDRTQIHDPSTGALYEYHRRDARDYQICATFALPSDPSDSGNWKHPAGRSCRWFSIGS
jgi:hypothetical protein